MFTFYLLLTVILFLLSFLSGMMGLGVAFIATPVLGLFGLDLKHEIMPLSLWLNGITAISSAITLARKGMVDWRTAIPLLILTTLVAPIGVWLLQFVATNTIWWIYVGVLLFLSYRMAFPPPQDDDKPGVINDQTRIKAGIASIAIGIFAGFLGVGPGFLMMPTLVLLGYTARIAAATNAVIVTLPSFSAFVTHLINAQFDVLLLVLTSVSAVLGAQAGASFMARRVKSLVLTRIFATALVFLALQRLWLLMIG